MEDLVGADVPFVPYFSHVEVHSFEQIHMKVWEKCPFTTTTESWKKETTTKSLLWVMAGAVPESGVQTSWKERTAKKGEALF